ncbi:hypothetical protein [Parvimonas micra]
MFKNKKFSLLGLIFVIFIFTACSSNKEISELFKKSKKVNNIQSYVLVNEIDYENKGNVKNQMMKAKLINDKDTKKIIKGRVSVRYSGTANYEKNNYDVIFIGDENKSLVMTKKVDGKESKTQKNNADYNINPDYFKLLDNIYSFDKEDLTFEETDSEYHLKLKNGNKNSKVFDLLKSEYRFSLNNVTEGEVDIIFETIFDKKTFYLKSIVWTVEYSGNKGAFKLKNTTTYSDWNNVNLDENR